MVIFVLGIFVDGGIYHHEWNKERRLVVVSDVEEVTGIGRAGIAPGSVSSRWNSR